MNNSLAPFRKWFRLFAGRGEGVYHGRLWTTAPKSVGKFMREIQLSAIDFKYTPPIRNTLYQTVHAMISFTLLLLPSNNSHESGSCQYAV